MKKQIPQRTRCLIQGCLYGLPFKKPKKYCMFCGEPRQELGVYSDATKPESDKESKCIQCEDLDYHMKCQECKERIDREPESDKERCESYVEGSDSEDKCKKCGMPFREHELKPGSVILVNDVNKFNYRSTKPQEELEVEEIGMIKRVIDGNEFPCYGLQGVGDKLNLLIKAHNALVKEVKNGK